MDRAVYVHPAYIGQTIGTQLLNHAKHELGPVIRLHCFQANVSARQFYERHAFRAGELGDGLANEEGRPDVLYEFDRSSRQLS